MVNNSVVNHFARISVRLTIYTNKIPEINCSIHFLRWPNFLRFNFVFIIDYLFFKLSIFNLSAKSYTDNTGVLCIQRNKRQCVQLHPAALFSFYFEYCGLGQSLLCYSSTLFSPSRSPRSHH